MIHVLLLEPDAWRYRGMWSVLRDSGDVDVVGELDYARILTLTEKPPDLAAEVILIAHRLVLEYGLAIVPLLRDLFNPCTVMVHGEVDSLEVAAQIYAAGARGYFALGSPPGRLAKAVNVLAEGKYWGPREAVAMMAEQMLEQPPAPIADDEDDDLGKDERLILALLHEGLSNKEIGQRLGLAEATVKARFNRLYKRFGVATRVQLLSAAMRRRIIQVS